MKQLYLVRHAKSSWKLDYLEDFERPLNKRGKREAPMMGELLHYLGVKPDAIISSPAARAASTARIIASAIAFPLHKVIYTEHLYDAGVKDLLKVIAAIDPAHGSAMIVSHDPGITKLAVGLGGSPIEEIPTAGVVAIEFPVENWGEITQGSGKVLFFEYPKKNRPASETDESGDGEGDE